MLKDDAHNLESSGRCAHQDNQERGFDGRELLLSLLKARPAWESPRYRSTLCTLFHLCLGSSADSAELWRQAWAANPQVVMYGIQDTCRQHPSCMNDALKALRAVEGVGEALHLCDDASFKVTFALAAHNAEMLSFTDWISCAMAREDGEEVSLECMDLATKSFQGQSDSRHVGFQTQQTLVALVKTLEGAGHSSGACRAAHERLRSASRGRLLGGAGPAASPQAPGVPAQGGAGAVGSGAGAAAGGAAAQAVAGEAGQQQGQQQSALFAPDIEEEANSHFQRIYTNKLQIEGVIQMLKGFKTSSNQVPLALALDACMCDSRFSVLHHYICRCVCCCELAPTSLARDRY